MKTLLSALLVSASMAGLAVAQDVPSGTYKLDPAHTTVVFSVSHAGFSMYRGTFEGVEGSLVWDAENPVESALTVAIDANSIDSPKAVSHEGNENFQQDIAKSALGSQTQPEITFATTRLERTGDDAGVAYGTLSFNGKEGPVELDVKLHKAGDFMGTPKMGFSGSTTIDRTKWGSEAWTQFGIGTDVTIDVQTEFAKAE